MKKVFFLLVLITSVNLLSAQNLDSLLTVARSQKNDSLKISKLNEIAFYSIFNNTELASKTINEAEKIALKGNNDYGLATITNTKGIYMDVTGKSDSAKYYFDKTLDISRENKFKDIEAKVVNNLGMYHWNSSDYQMALDYFFESLKMVEGGENRRSISSSYNNIGLIYQEMNLYDKALEYHKKALEIRKELNLKKDQVASYNNIGICYRSKGELDKSIEVYQLGIQLAKESNNLLDYYRLLDNLGNIYQDKGNYSKALETYMQSIDRADNYKADDRGLLATYSNIAAVYNRLNQPKKAVEYAKKGFAILTASPQFKHYANDLYIQVAESYYMLGNLEKARKNVDDFIMVTDSLFSDKNAKAIADLEVKYDTEKKEKEILIQRAELAEQEVLIQRRNYQIYGLIGLALILGLIGYLFYNQQKLKNVQLQKENELKDALLKIETQNKLQEQRLRISRDLHDNIGAQLTFIISSIDNLKYAFDINDEALSNKLNAISAFTSSTIYELRDTIWAMNKEKISFEDLNGRITNFIDKAKDVTSNIDFKFSVSEEISKQKAFSSLEGVNIYRIIQEAVNNSLKHANAKEISVNISKKESKMLISIADNGKGFNLNDTEKGNGLLNIEKRAKQLGAEFNLLSNPLKGTIIEVAI